jgi:hypothetical protein
MPSWPPTAGRTTITLELKLELVDHLDAQAEFYGMSRAAYIRQLVVKDMQRQGPGPAAANAPVQ